MDANERLVKESKNINVLSLFDGISCGQIALERVGIDVDNYFASEIDKYAIKVTKNNYPNTKHIGDVTEVKGADLPKIDLLIGGSPCFVAGTKVICNNKIKSIEEVVVGDEVLTHTGNYRKVLKIGGDTKDIYKIKAQGHTYTSTTSNHPYYVRKRHRVWNNQKRTYEWVFNQPEWVKVCDLNKGDYVGTPILNSNKNPYNLTSDECYLLGLYVGDGHTRKDFRTTENRPNDRHWQLIISVSSHEKETFNKTVNLKHGFYKHTKSVYRAVFSNKRLVEIAEEYCGVGAENKKFSKMILDLPINLLQRVIDGYEFADGSNRNDVFRATTISKSLVETLSLAIAKVYKTTCSIEYTIRPKITIIEGRTVSQKNTWTISYRKEHKKQSRAWVVDDVIWNPIKSIEKTQNNEHVYNIEVETDNSYIANGHIVHNCQGFSFAGKQLNFDDPRSKLFFEFVRLLEETKPEYFLLENVLMKKEYEQVITDHLGVEPILINSALVSAQNRKRLYWTNIPNVTQPEDKGITWGDVRERGVNTESYYYTEKAMQWLARVSQKKNKPLTVHSDTDKMQMLEASHHKKYSNQRFFGIVDLPESEQAIAAMRGRYLINGKRQDGEQETQGLTKQYIEFRYDGKTNALTTVTKDNVLVPFTLPDRIPTDEFFFRYITPLECERLQTVPDNEIICIFTSCLDQVKNYVDAVEKNPKLLKLVLSAEKEELNEFVKLVTQNTKQNHPQTRFIVPQNADMTTWRQTNQCTKVNAENIVMSKNQNQEVDSVLPNAFINIIEGRIMHFGKEELLLKDKNCTNRTSGNKPLVLFGKEIMELVKDVDVGMKKNSDTISTSTILSALSINSLEQMLTTYYLFAKNAITGYTQNTISQKNLSVQFQINDGYTSCVSNTQRYRTLGNGWTVDVIAHIFKGLLNENL